MSVFMNGVNSIARDRDLQSAFYGYNHSPVIRNGEFYDERNLSGEQFPALCARAPMGAITVNEEHPYTADKRITALYGRYGENLFLKVGAKLYDYAEDTGVTMLDGDDPENPNRQFVSMGAYLVLWPERTILNTRTGEITPMDAEETTQAVFCQLSRADGSELEGMIEQDIPPADPQDGAWWLDTSGDRDVLRQWSETQNQWFPINETYVRITFVSDVSTVFHAGDGIRIEGLTGDAAAFNGYHTLNSVGQGWIVFPGIIRATLVSEGFQTITREAPQMDFICEQNNRLYGCSSATNEIYASKFGDPTNWNVLEDGAAYASYVEQSGTPGKFTGCCAFRGNVLFFKEDCIHILYGSLPENFRLETLHAPGVRDGAFRSIAQGNEVLYYLSPDGVMAYSGSSSFPEKISDAFGAEEEEMYYGTGIVADGCYYLSRSSSSYDLGMEGGGATYRFEIERGIWHREDDRYYPYMATDGDHIYLLNTEENTVYTKYVKTTYKMGARGPEPLYSRFHFGGQYEPINIPFKELPGEERVSWMMQTGPMGLDSPDAKFISQITLRLMADAGTDIRLLVEYDDTGRFTEVMRIHRSRIGSFTLPFVPRRCDTMRLRIEGEGGFRLYSIAKTVEGR